MKDRRLEVFCLHRGFLHSQLSKVQNDSLSLKRYAHSTQHTFIVFLLFKPKKINSKGDDKLKGFWETK